MGFNFRKTARAVLATLVAAVTLLAGSVSAQAAQKDGLPGYWSNPGSYSDGSGNVTTGYHGFTLGPMAGSPGSYRYCIEAGRISEAMDGDWQTVTDQNSVTAAQMAYKYRDSTDDLTQAAIAYAIHDHLDETPAVWAQWKGLMNSADLENGSIKAVADRASELWTEAENMTVTAAETPQVKYTNGNRTGQVYAYLRNASGGYAAGVPYRVIYDSSMIRVDVESGVTSDQPITINWEALKTGTVKVHVEYDRSTARKLYPDGQKLFTWGDPIVESSPEVEFKLSKGMKVTLGSDATKAYESNLSVNEVVKTERGDWLKDTVTVNAVDQGNDGNNITDGLNHDINDWLTGNNGSRVPINVKVSVYGPYTDEQAQTYRDNAKNGKQAVPDGAPKIAEGVLGITDSGTYTISSENSLTYLNGLSDATLPVGHYTFVWEATNGVQDSAAIEQATGSPVQNESAEGADDGYPLLSGYTDGFFAVREDVKIHNFQPTLKSSTAEDNPNTVVENGLRHVEPGSDLKDAVTIGMTDSNGDGKVDTYDWPHTLNAIRSGDYREATQATLTARVEVYGPFTKEQAAQYQAQAKNGTVAVPSSAKKVAEGLIPVSKAGTYHATTADGTISFVDGMTKGTLERGTYTFVWSLLNSDQKTLSSQTGVSTAKDYPFAQDVTDGMFKENENIIEESFQPTLKSSVTDANKNATETVTGSDDKNRNAIQVADGMVYREKSAPLRDNVTIGMLDMNGDGKVDTHDWPHTAQGRDSNTYTEATQAPVTVVGEYIATADQTTYEKYLAEAKKGTLTSLPDGMKVYATCTFDVTKAGTYLVSSVSSDNPTSEWQVVKGESLDNLPSGYGTFRYRILNENQKNLSKSTGVAIAKDYPFSQEADDGYFATDETVYTRFSFNLDSQASFNTVKLGETTGDKLIVTKSHDKDKWPTYMRAAVVEGEESSRELVPLKLQGYLVKLSDDPEYKVTETNKMPDDANIVHKTTLDNITSYGEYDTASYTYNATGTFAWYWQMEPDLTTANHLTNEAWRKLTHGLVNHQFGLASEIVRVTDNDKTVCVVNTKAQGKVKAENGTADLHDTAYLTDCAKADTIEFELWKQNAGDVSNDTLVTTTAKQNVDKQTEITSPTVTQTVEDGDTYYWREIVYDKDGGVIAYGGARVNEETVEIESNTETPVCEVSTKSQGKVTATDGKADLHDVAYLNCAKAATIEFELWKQNEGDVGKDVRITVTQPQDASGKTEVTSHTVTQTVEDGDTYYWREITRDENGDVISYGDARVSEETVKIEAPLAQTGMMVGGVLLVVGGLAGAGLALNRASRKNNRKRHAA